MEHISHSEKETLAFGRELAQNLHSDDIVALHGDLGAGKTTLVKGIAAGLGVVEDMTSPTFTLMNVYQIGLRTSDLPRRQAGFSDRQLTEFRQFVHIDTYRLRDEKELIEIGVLDYLGDPETVCVVEWPEKIAGLLGGKKTVHVILEHGNAVNERRITISPP